MSEQATGGRRQRRLPLSTEVRFQGPTPEVQAVAAHAKRMRVSQAVLWRQVLTKVAEAGMEAFRGADEDSSRSRADVGRQLLSLIEGRLFGVRAADLSAAQLSKLSDAYFRLREDAEQAEGKEQEPTRIADLLRDNYGGSPEAVRAQAIARGRRWELGRLEEFQVEARRLDELAAEWGVVDGGSAG